MAELEDDDLEWAARIARKIARGLPKEFYVEDLIQTAQLAMLRARERFDPARGVPFRGWAIRAVRGACLMSARRSEWTNTTAAGLDPEPGDESIVTILVRRDLEADRDAVDAQRAKWRDAWRRRSLRTKLYRLTDKQAAAVRAVLIEDQRVEDYAKLIGETPGLVMGRLKKAVRALQEKPLSLGARKLRTWFSENPGVQPLARIAKEMKRTPRAVRNWTRELKAKGLLQMRRTRDGNEYKAREIERNPSSSKKLAAGSREPS